MEEKQDKNRGKKYISESNKSNNEKLDYYSDIKNNNKKDVKSNKCLINSDILNDIPLEQLQEILLDINDDKDSQAIQNLLLDEEFSSTVEMKKENKLITDFHYVTFKNAYGENSCFVNVILHLLNYIPELEDFLISLYQIDESTRHGKDSNSNDEKNKFLVLLGKIMYQYENIINEENDEENKKKNNKTKKSQITVIKTLNMRKHLANISENKFALNTIADPVELFDFILDILNEKVGEDLHKSFYLELIDEFNCRSKNNCGITIKNKYDKDNFIYHIYVDEILKYIDKNNIKVKNYKNKLFELSNKLFLLENSKKCEKCKEEMEHNLVCMNNPEFLLINCVWKESNPIVDDVISLLFLISLKDELNSLFTCYNKLSRKKNSYYLFGFILYSFAMSHYIICMYNYDKKVFALLDDETIKEYNNLFELILDITVNILKINDKGFFYPVMLIFTQENLYDYKTIKLNILNDSDYSLLINKCNEAIYECQTQNTMNEEEKLNNYKEYIEKQKEIENKILDKKHKKANKSESNDNKKEKKKTENGINYNNEKEKEEKINNKKEEVNNIEKNNEDKKGKNKIYDEINNNNKNEVDTSNKKYEENNNDDKNKLKTGLDHKNKAKIGQILKDIKTVKGSNYKQGLYIDIDKFGNKKYNNRKLEEEKQEDRRHELEEEQEKKEERREGEEKQQENKEQEKQDKEKIIEKEDKNLLIDNNYKRKKNYMERKADENIEEKEKENNLVYRKRIGIAESSNYYYYNNMKNKESDNIHNKQTPDYDTDKDKSKEISTNIVNDESNKKRKKKLNQNNIIWNNKTKNGKENENDNDSVKSKEQTYNYKDNRAEISYMTPKREHFHYSIINKYKDNNNSGSNNKSSNEKNDNKNIYKSEKKENLYKSKFMDNKIFNNVKEKDEYNNNNDLKIVQENIRKKYYIRKNKE